MEERLEQLQKKIMTEFKKYVKKFDMEDKAIVRKYYHSFRVMEHSLLIAKRVGLNENDSQITALVGLLHDIGRFEQWTKYKTYEDVKSIDHGELGVKLLFEDNMIESFCNLKENYDEIYDAIKYHNKKEIGDVSDHNRLFCEIIRDADKLDILYLYSIDPDIRDEDDSEISEEVKRQFFAEESVDSKDVKTDNDAIIRTLAFIYDMNFDVSFKYLKDYELYNKIYDGIKDKEKFKPYFEKCFAYINERNDKNA